MAEDSPDIRPSTPNWNGADTPERPSLSRTSSSLSGILSKGAERVGEDWAEGPLLLLDVVETFFDSRLDLWERKLKESSKKLRQKAGSMIPRGLRTPKGSMLLLDDDDDTHLSTRDKDAKRKMLTTVYRQDVEREVNRVKSILNSKINAASAKWKSAKVVRTREKVSFEFGVLTVAFTGFLLGRAPEWIPFAYTVQVAFHLAIRAYTYKKKEWHYFLFGEYSYSRKCLADSTDMCYFVNVLDLMFLWIWPGSTYLFICCYLLTMGPLASAVITWRNSLVFHSLDKVTSLFIHIYPPIVFTDILFTYRGANIRYPALNGLDNYTWWQKVLCAAVPYCIWQGLYWKFIFVDRKDKIESGARQSSFNYLLNDKHGPIGRALRAVKPAHRELWFIFGQFVYSIIFMIPAATILMHSHTASDLVIILLFVVAVWNGGNFYVEVFGRKFEKELNVLQREMEALTQTIASTPSTPHTDMTADSAAHDPRPAATVGSGSGSRDADADADADTADVGTPIDYDAKPKHAAHADRVDQEVKQRKGTGLENSPLVLPQAETSEPPEIKLDGKKEV